MSLTDEQYKEIRTELESTHKPLIFFDDDADGVAAFLLVYRFCKEGKGVVIKTTPNITEAFLRKVEEYQPDKILVLDIAEMEQEFIDKAKTPVVWIDHHEPVKRSSVKYFNPRISNIKDNLPTSVICYEAIKQDLWIAAIGAIGDWFIPKFLEEIIKEYPDLIKKSDNAGELLHKTKIGILAKVFSFITKGKSEDVMKCLKVLTRIESPYEILNQETSKGKFIYKRFEFINKKYEALLERAKRAAKKDYLVFIYENANSFTGDLSNELLYLFPKKHIIVGRIRNGELKLSLRSSKAILPAMREALKSINGFGGGHENACGAVIKEEDFKRFMEGLEKNLR